MVVIKGAGISGLTCALNLAKCGFDVELHEAAEALGAAHGCSVVTVKNGEGDTLDEMRGLSSRRITGVPVRRIVRILPDGRKKESKSGKPLYYNFLRGTHESALERVIARDARSFGARIIFRSSHAPSAHVIATGFSTKNVLGYGATFANARFPEDTVFLFLHSESTPDYTYIATHGQFSTICSVCFSRERFKGVPQIFNDFVGDNETVLSGLEGARKAAGIKHYASILASCKPVQRGKINIGEAAGFLDPLKGFGVRYAMLSGFLAASAIADGKDYAALCNDRIVNEIEGRRLLPPKP